MKQSIAIQCRKRSDWETHKKGRNSSIAADKKLATRWSMDNKASNFVVVTSVKAAIKVIYLTSKKQVIRIDYDVVALARAALLSCR